MNNLIFGIVMEVEGKNLKQDLIECLAYLERKYGLPICCEAGVKETQIIENIEIVPNPLINAKNLKFMYEKDPRKNVSS
jgi:hypothetical protein